MIPRLLILPILAAALAPALAVGAESAAPAIAARFADLLDTPARLSERAVHAPVYALARVDTDRVVGVGQRGHILRSTDRGRTWVQQASPVSTDLLAVHFPVPSLGWAVGHDGVVLRSTDGGATWGRVFDGRSLGRMMVEHYEQRAAAGDASVAGALEEARRMASEGPTKPFLSVHFRNEREGWLAGQFNLILHTSDGGASWQPWLDRMDNPDGYSLHTLRAAGDDIYIVGELGLVLRLDAQAQRFRRIETPYPGTWFGAAATRDTLVAFGLRGSAWSTSDAGAHWKQLDPGTTASVNNGMFLEDGRLLLATQHGELLTSADQGGTFSKLPPVPELPSAYDLMAMEPGWLLVSGPRGVRRIALPPPAP